MTGRWPFDASTSTRGQKPELDPAGGPGRAEAEATWYVSVAAKFWISVSFALRLARGLDLALAAVAA